MIRLVVLFGLVAPSFCQVPTSCAEVTCQPPLICDVQPLQCINPPCGDIATCVDPDAAACAAVSCMIGVPCRVINGRAQCVPNKPGACPVLPPGTIGLCVERCTGDHSCPNDQKCCSNGCGHDCMAPAPTSCAAVTCRQGTICIVKDGQAQCIDPDQPYCEYGEPLPNIFCGRGPSRQDCPSGYSCHVHPTDRFAVCCQVEKTGTCPAVPPGTVGICVEECSRDNDCQNDRKCCSNACGHVCKDPVTSPTCETTKCRKNEICEMVPAPCLIPPCPEFPRCRDPCANVRCEENEICELVQVQCIRAPCPPQPQCRNLCATVKCSSGYQCQVRNGQAVCVRTPAAPDSSHGSVSRWQLTSFSLSLGLLWSLPLLLPS